jgi:hypothetical protein
MAPIDGNSHGGQGNLSRGVRKIRSVEEKPE